MTVAIDMGMTAVPGGTAEPATLDLEELLATRLLVQGNSGSGKSHLLRRLLEQSASHVQQVVIDPEGDFVTLADRFGHVVIDGDRSPGDLEAIAARIREHRVSAVLTLDSLDADGQMRAAATFLNALFEADRDHWYPALVVVDEAQLFAPAVSGEVAEETRKASLGAMTNLMCRGRKRGLAGVIATQRLAKLAKNVAAEATNFLMGRTFLDIDMARAADLLGLERRQAEMFRDLGRGQFVALGPALSRRPLAVKVGPTETQARAATPKLTPLPAAPSDATRDLILAPVPFSVRPAAERRTPAPPAPTMNQILEQIVRDRPPEADAEPGPEALSTEARKAAFLAIAQDILQEREAAFRLEATLFQDFGVRCRIARLGGPPLPLGEFRLYLNAARARVDLTIVDALQWEGAIDLARTVPDDLQAVFLIVAGAALHAAPCPSDADIAARCGQHSAGRARSRLRHLEKSGLIVIRPGISGFRSAILPDLGWETGFGDPNLPASVDARPKDQLAAE